MKYLTAIMPILLLLIAGILIGRTWFTPSGDKPDIIVDTTYITHSDTLYIDRPVPIKILEPTAPLPAVDTAAIIADYLRSRVYTDTLINRPELVLILTDTVHQNALLGRDIQYTLTTPVVTQTKAKARPFSLYLLADSRLAATLIVERKRWVVQGGYDINNKQPLVGVGYKLY